MLLDSKIPGKIALLEKTYDGLRYASVQPISMDYAETSIHYRGIPPQDSPLEWRHILPGQAWGDSWITAWFRGSITLPESLHGQTVFLRATTGAPESMLLIDGQHSGMFDPNHPVRVLALSGVAGHTYDVHLEGYAGHTFPGTQPYDNPIAIAGGASQDGGVFVGKNSRHFQGVELVTERADVSAFVYELRTLRQLAATLEENSLRRGRIQVAMQEIFTLVYAKPEDVCEEVWRKGLGEARKVMRPLLDLKNGPTTPTAGIIGHSHIDTAWLWTVQETWRKCARTFSSILSLMDQYPEFRWVQSAPYHADVMRRLYPEIFARMQERVKDGRWEINGAMWIEPDCNIPSGEALVRQCLVGQRATREMFGATSDTLWQPDVFGYSAALPQILRGSGVEFFCTTKLGWNDTNRFPCDTFHWEGIDGSSVLSHFNLIHCWPDPETIINSWKRIQHKDVQDRQLISFGFGDGGGGPMAEMIEMARLVKDLEGCPKTEYSSVSEFMTGCRDDLKGLPTWSGELYLELHRGTLTSIAAIKRLNRKCELALRDAEFAATLSFVRKGTSYPADELLDGWKTLLLNQFHDILPGSSIAEVNDEAISTMGECLVQSISLRDKQLANLVDGGSSDGILIANSLSWSRTSEVELEGIPAGKRPAGERIVAQEIEDVEGTKKLAVSGLNLPALSYQTMALSPVETSSASPFTVNSDTIRTPYATVRIDKSGRITSFYDLTAQRELVRSGGAFNTLLIGEDVPAAWDNWDIDRDQRLKLAPVDTLLKSEIVANGPLQLRLRQEYKIGHGSTLTQDIVFHSTTPRVDFDTIVDWSEKYTFLKTGFALDVLADSARHEIQFGHVTRSTHDNTSYDRAQFDVCAHKWTDLSENGYGVAFLNDSKYGCTTKDGEYRLSLIKSGRHPDPRGDEGRHRFSYAMLPHADGFSVESVVRPAYELNLAPAVIPSARDRAIDFNLASLDAANVIVEAVKLAEEGDGIILRLYEAGKTGTHVNMHFNVPVATLSTVNMLEEEPESLSVDGNRVHLYFKPFEIKTLKLKIA